MARASGLFRSKDKDGFTYPEMAFLLIVLALFLAGTVWVVNGAIVKSHPLGKNDSAGREADKALDRIESMVKAARQFDYTGELKAPGPGLVAGSLDFLADLDGDPQTGSYEVVLKNGSVVKGLERVVIAPRGISLVTYVYSRPGAVPGAVVLLKNLSPGDKQAFLVRFQVAGSAESTEPALPASGNATTARPDLVATAVRVSITTGLGGSRLVIERGTGLPARPGIQPALPPVL